MKSRNCLLSKAEEHMNTELNPAKVSFHDQGRDGYKELKSISEILIELEISKTEYKNMLPFSDDNDLQINLGGPLNSCFVNNYFKFGVLAWEPNMDIQPVINHYKAITYTCAYLS